MLQVLTPAQAGALLREKFHTLHMESETVPLEQAEQIPSEDRDEPQAVRIALEQALEWLPEEERELIFLRYTNEMPVAEIAAILGISRFAVYRQERRALEHLRKQLNRRDFYG